MSVDIDAASVADADLSDAEQSFVLAAATADGLSVGVTDAAEIVTTVRDHDGRDTVSMASVFALATRYGLSVVDGEAHWDSETVELVVVDGGWQSGGEHETEETDR